MILSATHPDTRAGLAIEDRDLIAEAHIDNSCLAYEAAINVLDVLYPPIAVGERVIVFPSLN